MFAFSVVADIIWMLVVGGLWTTTIPNDPAWNSLYWLHLIIKITSILTLLTKIGIVFLLLQLQQIYSKSKFYRLFFYLSRAFVEIYIYFSRFVDKIKNASYKLILSPFFYSRFHPAEKVAVQKLS